MARRSRTLALPRDGSPPQRTEGNVGREAGQNHLCRFLWNISHFSEPLPAVFRIILFSLKLQYPSRTHHIWVKNHANKFIKKLQLRTLSSVSSVKPKSVGRDGEIFKFKGGWKCQTIHYNKKKIKLQIYKNRGFPTPWIDHHSVSVILLCAAWIKIILH